MLNFNFFYVGESSLIASRHSSHCKSINPRVRPYYREYTWTRPISEVKPGQAQLVLRWATTWEHWVLYAFFYKKNIFPLGSPVPVHWTHCTRPLPSSGDPWVHFLSVYFFGIYSFHSGGLGKTFVFQFFGGGNAIPFFHNKKRGRKEDLRPLFIGRGTFRSVEFFRRGVSFLQCWG